MTTPDGRDARSGESFAATDPSVGRTGAEASASTPQRTPRTPGSDAPTENTPRTGDDDPQPSDSDSAQKDS